MPCPDCGEAVERTGVGHSCRAERLIDAELAALRAGLETLEFDVHRFLDTPEGRFETWLAARRVRRSRWG
ncbi:MAG TPA: hypothetical protein VFV40_01450 [Nocardioides sp.]|nr:hypothetical protein [Nocardioides sp.]